MNIMRSRSSFDLKAEEAPKVLHPCKANWRPFLSLLYVLISSISDTATYVLLKQLPYINPAELSIVRNAGVFIFGLPVAVYSVKNVLGPKNHRFLILSRSFLSATGIYLSFLTFSYLPLTESAILLSTVPAVVSIIARVSLKESFGFMQACGVAISFAGALLSTRLPEVLKERKDVEFNSDYFLGLGCGLSSVITISTALVMIRKMKEVHSCVFVLFSGFIGIIENAIVTVGFSSFSLPLCGPDSWKMALIGVFGILTQTFFIMAMVLDEAGFVTAVGSGLEIVWAILFQIIIYGLVPDIYNIGGAILVTISIAVFVMRKWLLSLPEDANARILFKHVI